VAGQSADNLSLDDVEALLRGEPGSTVHVTVERKGEPAPLTFTLTREQVELPDVTYRGRVGDEKQLGYVKLERFTRDAPGEVEAALREFQDTGGLQGVVLDLRDNPGGLLRAAVRITGLFVSQGAVVVSTQGRNGSSEESFRSERAPLMPNVPLVILVNGESASASEIVAGAIQDHDRGVVMGTITYGKGLVQKVQSLPHNMALKLTTAQYHTPSGRTIQNLGTAAQDTSGASSQGRLHETERGRTVRDGDGIRPDVRVQASSASSLERALTEKAAFFRYANHYAATHDTLAADFSVTNADLSAFRTWLEEEGVRCPTSAQQSLDSLQTRIETSGYEGVQDEVTALAAALRDVKQAAFDRYGFELRRHLKREILARYVPADRQVAALLPGDTQVTAATELLLDADRYERILRPPSER
jgi:carboxyl-terminal processing protease